jgi:hypothetical protein
MRTLALPILILAAGVTAGEKPLKHPCFNDQGTLPWYETLATASAAAKKQGKLVLIEYGREA